MHATIILRKLLFLTTGRIVLSDRVRNCAYQWAWSYLHHLPQGARICDIGSRSSAFPAFLAWRGFSVTAIEPDARFSAVQTALSMRWNRRIEVVPGDMISLSADRRFHSILSVFSLQHAGDDDIDSYVKAARSVEKGGWVLTINECTSGPTKWQRGRDDGDLRIYGTDEIGSRIEATLKREGLTIKEKTLYRFSGGSHALVKTLDERSVNVCFIAAKNSAA
jgi:hypothetical protein